MKKVLVFTMCLIASFAWAQSTYPGRGGTGTATDTTSLSARIDLKANTASPTLTGTVTAGDSLYAPKLRVGTLAGTVRSTNGASFTATASDTVGLAAALAAKQSAASFADSARANGIGVAGLTLNQTVYAGAADSIFSRWDTCAIFSFGLGSGGAGDTTVMVANADCGGFLNGPDSIVVTKLHVAMRGEAGDTVRVNVAWSDTLGAVAPTLLNTTPLGANSITVGVTDASFDNAVIPPNAQVYGLLSTVVAGSKPSLLRFTLIGYRKR